MKKLFKNRNFLAAAAIALSLVICFVVAPMINASASKQLSIVRVSKEIPEGTKITSGMLQTVKVGGYNLPSDVVKSQSSTEGKYALATMEPGDYILSSKISEKAPNNGLSSLDGKEQAVSVSIKSFAAGLSGKLKPDDIISFYIADYGDMKETLSPPELQYVKLLSVTTDTGEEYSEKSNDTATKSAENDMPSTLTVLATPAQAVKLVDYDKNGTLYAALVYRGTTPNANKFLSLENEYLNSQAGGTTDNGK